MTNRVQALCCLRCACLAPLAIMLLLVGGSGTAVAASTPADELDPQAEGWPWYRGPYGCGRGIESAEPWVEDLSQARLVWKSEDWIPITDGTIRGGGGFRKPQGRHNPHPVVSIFGSHSSPVMQDGRIYVYYFMASKEPVVLGKNKLVSAKPDKHGRIPKDRITAQLKELPFELSFDEYQRLLANIHGDDVLHCFDAETGKTLWRTAVPGALNFQAQSYGPHLTPTVNQGRAFAIGTTGRVMCCDAKTGELLWTNEESTFAQKDGGSAGKVARQVEKGTVAGVIRSRYEMVAAVDGVVAFQSFKRGGLCGIDAETGKMIWQGVGGNWMLVPWKSEGKWYFLAGATCIDPKTGKVAWSEKLKIHGTGTRMAVDGDILVCGLTAFRITPRSAEKIWEIPDPLGYGDAEVVNKRGKKLKDKSGLGLITSQTIYRGHLYITLKRKDNHDWRAYCVELETGAIKAHHDFHAGHANGTMMTIANGRYFFRGHGAGPTLMFKADPADHRPLGKAFKLPDSNSYTPIFHDGRVYLRGGNHLWCFDMRKRS